MPACRACGRFFCLLPLLWAIVGLLTGCAGLRPSEIPTLPEGLPARSVIEAVPFYPQSAYQCGPAALAMVLTWSGLPIVPEALQSQVYTPSRKGSLQMALISAARRHGRVTYEIQGVDSIWPEIAAGHPVIILQNLGVSWFPVWHYAVVIGYDFPEKIVILHSGVTERKVTSLRTFEKTWARGAYWGLMVLEPTKIPALAKENDYLAGVLGLERAHQFRAAVSGYRTALSRWPNSLAAGMGLGNSYYALGDLEAAEAAFRIVVENHPQAGAAYNNLAQVLLEQGRLDEALSAARTAVSIGGPMHQVFHSTLEEVLSAQKRKYRYGN